MKYLSSLTRIKPAPSAVEVPRFIISLIFSIVYWSPALLDKWMVSLHKSLSNSPSPYVMYSPSLSSATSYLWNEFQSLVSMFDSPLCKMKTLTLPFIFSMFPIISFNHFSYTFIFTLLRLITFTLCYVIIFKCAIIKLIYWFQKLNTSRQSLYDHSYSFHCIVKLCWNSNRSLYRNDIMFLYHSMENNLRSSSIDSCIFILYLVALIISSSCFKHSIMISVSRPSPPFFLLHTAEYPGQGGGAVTMTQQSLQQLFRTWLKKVF